MKMKIREFFELMAKEGGSYEVKTPQGWIPLGDLYVKLQKDCYMIRLDSGLGLGCSSDHLIMTKRGWVFSKDLDVESDEVQTESGFEKISSLEEIGKLDTYDWEVLSDEHAYYSNGIVSHNTGKTSLIKQFAQEPIEWCGKQYDGWKVVDIPLAQFEEMGDILGMPDRNIKVCKDGHTDWVPEGVIDAYVADGWTIDHLAKVRTCNAPPDWVPTEEGPTILLFDDWNRARSGVIKGIMQLLQNYGTISWKLPKGCHIVMTANPDEQDYQVTTLDPAIHTRIKSMTVKTDVESWVLWADKKGVDPRIINWALRYPEMMSSGERTNLRTVSELGFSVKHLDNLSNKDQAATFKNLALSVIDEESVASLMTFIQREVDLVLEPLDILNWKPEAEIEKKISGLMTGSEKRVDILGIICDRLCATCANMGDVTETHKANFQKFIMMSCMPDEYQYSLVQRMVRNGETTKRWTHGNKLLVKIIMELLSMT